MKLLVHGSRKIGADNSAIPFTAAICPEI